ncbi:hypothetical protein ABH927_002231 [Planotetraspora sp. GP83]
MMLREARRFVMSLRARSALEFAGQRALFLPAHAHPQAQSQAHWQEDMSMDAPQTIADRYRVTGAQEGPC